MNHNLLHSFLMPYLIIPIFAVAFTAFWIWQFVKCCLQEPPGCRKILWLVLIALTHWIGAIIYYFYKLIHQK